MSCNADTGECVAVNAEAVSVEAEPAWGPAQSVMAGAVALLVLIIFVPPVINRALRRGK
jgi:hypothetical protein